MQLSPNLFKSSVPENIETNSPYDFAQGGEGIRLTRDLVFDASGATGFINFAKLTGSVVLLELGFIMTEVTTFTNCTAVKPYLIGGTVIDLAAPVDISNAKVGSLVVKYRDETEPMLFSDSVLCAYQHLGSRFPSACLLTESHDTETWLRINYATTDEPIDAKAKLFLRYLPIDDGKLTIV